MTSQVKISVVIPIYNVAPYLVICVDDGSTDGSGAIADRYAGLDSRVIVFHQNNRGAAMARNIGLAHAGGE
jgi:glycosyltransferase involved in cell wall biosynthesis